MESAPFPLRPDRQALVIVDMQNDFVREDAPQEVPDARGIIPAVQMVLAAFRAAGRPVFFTRFIAGPSRTLMWAFSPECTDDMRSCWRGQQRRYGDRNEMLEGPEVVDELIPRRGEAVVDKFGYSAFHNTNLADALRANGVGQVVVAGTVTQICVEDTVRGGFHHGLEMVVMEDAVASFDAELHSASLKGMSMKYALVVDSETVVEHLDRSGMHSTEVSE
jgi:nicotinamidase-related amidase